MTAADETVSACRFLTMLGRVSAQIAAQPVEVIASDDIWSGLEDLVERVHAAKRAAATVHVRGQVGRACTEDLRRSSRVFIELTVAHDDDGDAVMGSALNSLERLLDDTDVDVIETSTRWQVLELGRAST